MKVYVETSQQKFVRGGEGSRRDISTGICERVKDHAETSQQKFGGGAEGVKEIELLQLGCDQTTVVGYPDLMDRE